MQTTTTPAKTTRRAAPAPAAPSSPDMEPDFIDRVVGLLSAYSPDVASRSDEIAQDLRAQFGGQRWYIHAHPQTARERRVADVLALFNGRNATAVARELGINRATVYRILKQPGRAPDASAAGDTAIPR